MQLELWQWAVVVAVTFASALLQGTIGFGYAVVAVPVLSLVDPNLAPVPQLLTALPLTLLAAGRERSYIDFRGALWILLGRFPGALLGAALLGVVSAHALDLSIGLIVLGAVVILATPIKLGRSPATDFCVSVFASCCGYVSAIGGPPIALLFRDASGPTVRSTLGFLFAVGLLVTLGVRAAFRQFSMQDLLLGAILTPVVVLGVWASRLLHSRVDQGPVLRRCVLATSSLAALGLVGRALF